jgi:hypothetical protein
MGAEPYAYRLAGVGGVIFLIALIVSIHFFGFRLPLVLCLGLPSLYLIFVGIVGSRSGGM